MMKWNNRKNNVSLLALKQITLEEYAKRPFFWVGEMQKYQKSENTTLLG
jgi:hypothetical protein